MKSRTKRKYIVAAVLIVLIGVLLVISQIGNFLVADDSLENGTVVILMGSIADRALEAADVYNEGYADSVVLVDSYMNGYDKLVERGVVIPGYADISKMAAVELGIPQNLVVLLEGNARSTRDEAVTIKEYLMDNKEITTIVLVTSSYHSKRSKLIFSKVLKELDRVVKVIARPSKYDDFNPERWWSRREDAKRVVLEYLKLSYFYLWEQYR